ncbi:FAD-dependent oxidoreductase [uncultured Cloacibacillus sp.]|uniref:FAD-dependent oxidoreductase n=1 Tax=uncultured Cloacibacillus sp. TaxID=889794 RepID=UPI00258D88B9|nr:FAD-dependent oxidoreductase [uncultured Cloacibacillus sp.]
MKILVIGGVAAGTKVAAKLKREDRGAEVRILVKDKDISYAGCGLPYYVGGVIADRGALIVNTPEKFSALTGAAVLTGKEAVSLDREAKLVTAVDTETGESEAYSYDKLVIATGASPVAPPFPGINLKNVFFMRKPEDAVSLRAAVDTGEIRRAVVCGGGFIGLEVAENLAAKGVRVSVIDMAEQILPGFDPEMAAYAERHLADHGIACFTGAKLEEIIGGEKVEKIRTDKRAMKADAVVLSLGIRPNTAFLAGSGIELAPGGTIKVDGQMRTNDPDVYAVGDCAMVTNRVTGAPAWSPMGSSANIEGRLAARVLAGEALSYPGVLGTGVCKLPELNVGRTGLTEAAAKEAGYDVVTVTAVVDDKAHYYPGASNFIVKMIADRQSGKFLGLQALGKGAVDKMVDIAVVALTLGASLHDLENMDLAYAPPFSTAIHPFAHTLNVLLNKISGGLDSFTPAEYAAGLADDYKIVDVSINPSLEGAPYVDLTKIAGPLPEYGTGDKLLLVCAKGKRAYLTQNRMKFYGYGNTKVLEAGHIFNEIDIEE